MGQTYAHGPEHSPSLRNRRLETTEVRVKNETRISTRPLDVGPRPQRHSASDDAVELNHRLGQSVLLLKPEVGFMTTGDGRTGAYVRRFRSERGV